MRKKTKNIIAIVVGLILAIIIILLLIKGCGKKEYAITFDSNGGSNVQSVTVIKDDTLEKPKDPTREGYEFQGWYLDGKLFDFSEKITKDMVLEARWEKAIKEVTGISLNATELTLKPDGKGLLSVIFTPEGSTSELEWSSSDDKIVTVKDGELKALKTGEVTITVTTKDGKYKATCKIKVEDDVKSVTSVSISGKKEVNIGESIKLTASIKPKDATNKEVSWTSSNPSIATVDKNGNVKGIKSGKVTITVTTVDGEKKATISIEVKEKKTETTTPTTPTDTTVKVKGISAKIDKSKMYVGEKAKITYVIDPSNAKEQGVTFSTDKSGIVSIDANGNVTGLKAGSVTITITTKDGSKKATVSITIEEKPSTPTNPSTGNTPSTGGTTKPEETPKLTKVTINGPKTVEEGKTITLDFSITDKNYKYSSVTWEIKNISGEATITNGKVTGVKEGKVEVTLTVDGVSTTYEITVTEKIVEYVITFTRLLKYDDTWDQYQLKGVTADGQEFTNFNYFTYNSDDFGVEQITRVLNKSKVNENIKSVTMYLTNGKTVTATVKYDSKKID